VALSDLFQKAPHYLYWKVRSEREWALNIQTWAFFAQARCCHMEADENAVIVNLESS
jgi:hypothetical protein